MRPRIAGGDTACVDGGRGSRLLAVIEKLFEALVVFTLIVGVWFVVAVVVRVVSAFALAQGPGRQHRHRAPRPDGGRRDPGWA